MGQQRGGWLPSRTTTTAALARGAALGLAGFLALVALLHPLRPDLDPGLRTISEYAVGPHGALMVFAFLMAGTGDLALAVALERDTALMRGGRALPALLGICGLGTLLCAAFPTDSTLAGTPATPIGITHNLAATIALGAGLAALPVAARRCGREPRWRALAAPTWAVLLLTFGGCAAGAAAGRFGWAERALVAGVFLWHMVLAWRAQALAGQPGSMDGGASGDAG